MHKIQQAFVDEQAVQCGYCINGMIMTSKALLDKNPKPTEAQIKEASGRQSVPLRHPCPNPARGQTGIGAVSLRRSEIDENHRTHSPTISQNLPARLIVSFNLFPLTRRRARAVECRSRALTPTRHNSIPGSPSRPTVR